MTVIARIVGLCTVLGMAVFSFGCTPAHRGTDRLNLSGYSAAFRQGYADGCDSAQSTLRRDAKRYRSDADYKFGWNDGYSVCGKR